MSARGQRVRAGPGSVVRGDAQPQSQHGAELQDEDVHVVLLQQSVFKVGSRVAGRVSAANADQNSLVGFPLSPRSHPHDYLPSQRTLLCSATRIHDSSDAVFAHTDAAAALASAPPPPPVCVPEHRPSPVTSLLRLHSDAR